MDPDFVGGRRATTFGTQPREAHDVRQQTLKQRVHSAIDDRACIVRQLAPSLVRVSRQRFGVRVRIVGGRVSVARQRFAISERELARPDRKA